MNFGTGHATMTYLTYVDFDTIKIDKSYIQGIDQDKTKRDILKHLLSLIEISDADVLVEGVETEGEADILKKLGLTLAQGYFYGRPSSLAEITDNEVLKAGRKRILSIVQKA
jgi:EAL domain-containing protein (putative c-di-GMP-specific phosphodiesterase class I)